MKVIEPSSEAKDCGSFPTSEFELQSLKAELFRLQAEHLEYQQLSVLSSEIGHILSQSQSLADRLEHCLQKVVQRLSGIVFARIWTFDSKAELLELQAIAGQHHHTEDFPGQISLGISIIGFIAQNRAAYVTNAATTDCVIGAKAWMQQEEIAAFAGYPLLIEDRLVGVLALCSRQPFSTIAQSTLSTIATTIAITIDQVWAREELVTGREALLFRLANQIRDSLDVNTILDNAVHEIQALLQIDSCHMLWYVPRPDQPFLFVTHEARNLELPSLIGEYPIDQVEALYERVLSLQMVRTNDVTTDATLDEPLRQCLQSFGILSQLLLPIETHAGEIGAIVCSHRRSTRLWTDSEVELLQAVVDQLALAIDQAELYTQTKDAAIAAQTQAEQLSAALYDLQQTQAHLVQSEKMSSLGQMVAGVAHEINNPVNFITGNLTHASTYTYDLLRLVELYREHCPTPPPHIEECEAAIDIEFIQEDLPRLLSSMKVGADRIRQIVLSLRNFSRLDEAEMKPVDIHEGIDSTLMILQNRLKAASTQAAVQVIKSYASLPPVECYAGQLNQVFMNVLSNAIDVLDDRRNTQHHTYDDQAACDLPTIWVETECLNPDWVTIRIRDNGPGMSEAVQKQLFDPFFTTKPVGKGTGLGLSISYQIVVDRHRGKFECHSQPEHGAEFQIQIPIKPS